MLNNLNDLKLLVGVSGDACGVDDTTALTGPIASGRTAWGLWLSDTADRADEVIQSWLEETPTATTRTIRAEVLLVQAEIALQFGFVESTSPQEITVGGSEGERIRYRSISLEERGLIAAELRNRAFSVVTGSIVSDWSGVM